MCVAIRIDEDLEVVVVKDHRVALGERRPDVRLLQLGADVKVLVVPHHLHARAKSRPRPSVALDVDERIGPGRGGPGRFVKLAVDVQWRRRAITDVTARRERERLEVDRGPLCSERSGSQSAK